MPFGPCVFFFKLLLSKNLQLVVYFFPGFKPAVYCDRGTILVMVPGTEIHPQTELFGHFPPSQAGVYVVFVDVWEPAYKAAVFVGYNTFAQVLPHSLCI